MASVLVAVPEKGSIDVCFTNPSKTESGNRVTWIAEEVHKVAVAGRQKKPFELNCYNEVSFLVFLVKRGFFKIN